MVEVECGFNGSLASGTLVAVLGVVLAGPGPHWEKTVNHLDHGDFVRSIA